MKRYQYILIVIPVLIFQLIFSSCYTVLGETVREEEDADWDRYYQQNYQKQPYSHQAEQQNIEEYDTVYVDANEESTYEYNQTPFVQNINIYNTPVAADPFYTDDFDWHFSFYLGMYSGYFVNPVWDWWYWRPGRLIVWDPWWWDYYYYYNPYHWAYGGYYWYGYPIYYDRPGKVINIARRNWNKRRAFDRRDRDEDVRTTRNRRLLNNDPVPVRAGTRGIGQGGSVDIKEDPTKRTRTIRTLDPATRDGKGTTRTTVTKERTKTRKTRTVIRQRDRSTETPNRIKEKPKRKIRRSKSSVRRNNRINSTTRPKPVYVPRSDKKTKIYRPAPKRSHSVSNPGVKHSVSKPRSLPAREINNSTKSRSSRSTSSNTTRTRRSRTR